MTDAGKLHQAVLGVGNVAAGTLTQAPTMQLQTDVMDDPFRLWVHRLAMINATVAATLSWKLVKLDAGGARDDLVRAGLARPITKAGRRWIQSGSDDMRVPASVRKATRYRLDDAVELEAHAAIDLLQQANPWTDGYGLMEATYADLQLFGTAYWYGAGDEQQPPSELWRMMPDRMRPIADPREFVSGFRYRMDGGGQQTFTPREVVWFRRYSPGNPYQGTGELQAWGEYVQAAGYIGAMTTNLFQRGGAPEHVVVTPHPVSEQDKRAFRSRWRKLFGALWKRAESVAFLTGDMRLERLGQTSRELEFSESSRLVRDFLCAGFGVPKALLTPEDANRATTKEATDQHLRLTVWPLACRVFDTINEQLLYRRFPGQGLVLVPDNPIRTDAATRGAERASKLASGWSVNEIRREDGAEPLDDPAADLPMVGGGIRPLEQAVAPPPPPPTFGPPPAEDDQDDDGEADDESGDGDQGRAPEDPPEADPAGGARVDRALPAIRRRRAEPRPCTCVPAGGGVVKASDAWGVQLPTREDLELASKAAAIPDDPDDIQQLARIIAGGMRQLRAALSAVAADIADPTDAAAAMAGVQADVVRALTEEANQGLRAVVTAEGQAVLNGLRPGIGVAFNGTNPLVVDFIAGSAGRIAQTAAGSYVDATVRQLQTMIRQGTNPREAAKDLAMTNRTELWMARRMARTEARFASAFAQDEGMAQSGVVEAKRFQLSSDPCELCEAVDQHLEQTNPSREFQLRQPMFASGFSVDLPPAKDGAPRTYVMDYLDAGQPGPPIHPNCRCSMRAVLIGG